MLRPYRTSLRLASDPGHPIQLGYIEAPLGGLQARLAGRMVLRPDIDLGEVSCRAVIDWLEIRFSGTTPTQFRYVKDLVDPIVGASVHVEMEEATAGGVSATFTLRIQEARLAVVQAVAEAVILRFGEALPPKVAGMEVSVDFYPKVPSDEKGYRLAGILSRHLLPTTDYMTSSAARPRGYWADNAGRTEKTKLLPFSSLPAKADFELSGWERDEPGPVDGTFYVGAKGTTPSWRIMYKRLDRQNPLTGTRRILEPEERRSRLEVTLGIKELRLLGVSTLADLRTFTFSRLQGMYFKLKLPTFADSSGKGSTAVRRHLEDDRRRKFLSSGVIGLLQMDAANIRIRKKRRPDLLRFLRLRGIAAPRAGLIGVGKHGSFAAYDDLCGRVEMALTKLGERERG